MQQRAVGRVAARAPAAEQPDPAVARRIAGGAIGMARAVLDFDQHLAARQRAVRVALVAPYLPVESVDRLEPTAVAAPGRADGVAAFGLGGQSARAAGNAVRSDSLGVGEDGV